MNKKELIEHIEDLPYNEGLIVDTIKISRKGLLELVKQLDEPQKPVVPQFVVDWIEECKNDDFHLFGAMEAISLNQKKLDYWFREDDNMELFARAWLDGSEVEKEKRYLVKMKGVYHGDLGYANTFQGYSFYNKERNLSGIKYKLTRKELEDAGFGEVFNSPLFEVEEVTE